MRTVLLLVLIMFFMPAYASTLTLASGDNQTALVELFSSEGCSSCPPADRWLSLLKNDPGLWRNVVPVALHVDYWDGIGWKDPFASAANTQRQQVYQQQGNIRQVYTPGVVLNGAEWRGWIAQRAPFPSPSVSAGVLRVTLEDEKFTASFTSTKAPKATQLHIAILGFSLESHIGAGENSGKILRHDFVALAREKFDSENSHWHGAIPTPRLATPPGTRRAVVAWVTDSRNQRPLQATGGWLGLTAH